MYTYSGEASEMVAIGKLRRSSTVKVVWLHLGSRHSVLVNDDIFDVLGQASAELVGDNVVRDRWKGCGLQGFPCVP